MSKCARIPIYSGKSAPTNSVDRSFFSLGRTLWLCIPLAKYLPQSMHWAPMGALCLWSEPQSRIFLLHSPLSKHPSLDREAFHLVASLPESSSKRTHYVQRCRWVVVNQWKKGCVCMYMGESKKQVLLTPDLKYFRWVPLTILKVYTFHWCFLLFDNFSRRAVLLSSSGSGG